MPDPDSTNQVIVVGTLLLGNAAGIAAAFVGMKVAIAIMGTKMEERDKLYNFRMEALEKDINGLGNKIRNPKTGETA